MKVWEAAFQQEISGNRLCMLFSIEHMCVIMRVNICTRVCGCVVGWVVHVCACICTNECEVLSEMFLQPAEVQDCSIGDMLGCVVFFLFKFWWYHHLDY